MSVLWERQKLKAKLWAENIGIRPHKNKANQLQYGKEFLDNSGLMGNRKKTVKGHLNKHANFHNPTCGVALTRKYLNLKKKKIMVKPKCPVSDFREIPSHYRDMVNREYKKRENTN